MNKDIIFNIINKYKARFIDLRFTTVKGQEQHITVSSKSIDKNFIKHGITINPNIIGDWGNEQSCFILFPDILQSNLFIDPIYQDNTLMVRCNIFDINTMLPHELDSRSIAKRAELYLKQTEIANNALFKSNIEFFLFEDVRWEIKKNGSFYKIDSEDLIWNSGKSIRGGNIGYRPNPHSGYFSIPPIDVSHDLRSEICKVLESLEIFVQFHNHESMIGNHCKISTNFNCLHKQSDDIQILKYIVKNIANNFGKTATFMPKPIIEVYGNSMYCYNYLIKNGKNLFVGDRYSGLSKLAMYYIGGILKHARSLNAFTNPSTNSYNRFLSKPRVPNILSYSNSNINSIIYIPNLKNKENFCIEIRFPDPIANPYLVFSSITMAGLDGIKNKIYPGSSIEEDITKKQSINNIFYPNKNTMCTSLQEAIHCLKHDYKFLLYGNVFTKNFINKYIQLLEKDDIYVKKQIHPVEFELYYSN